MDKVVVVVVRELPLEEVRGSSLIHSNNNSFLRVLVTRSTSSVGGGTLLFATLLSCSWLVVLTMRDAGMGVDDLLVAPGDFFPPLMMEWVVALLPSPPTSMMILLFFPAPPPLSTFVLFPSDVVEEEWWRWSVVVVVVTLCLWGRNESSDVWRPLPLRDGWRISPVEPLLSSIPVVVLCLLNRREWGDGDLIRFCWWRTAVGAMFVVQELLARLDSAGFLQRENKVYNQLMKSNYK